MAQYVKYDSDGVTVREWYRGYYIDGDRTVTTTDPELIKAQGFVEYAPPVQGVSREGRILELKDRLASTDYISLKAFEGCDMSEYGDWKADRQALRDEINALAAMTDEEYAEKYADEETAES